MVVVVPVSGAIRRREGNDQHGLDLVDDFFLNNFFFGRAGEAENFRNRANPVSSGFIINGAKVPSIVFIINNAETRSRSVFGGNNIVDGNSSQNDHITIGFSVVEVVSGESEVEGINGGD